MPDPYMTDRPSAYYDNLLVNSDATARYLMKTYSVHPPDDADGEKGNLVRNVEGVRDSGAIKISKMFNKKVAYLHLNKRARGHASVTGNEGGDTLYGSASYNPNSGVPVYWLPWDAGGAIISINLPKKGTGGRDQPDPDRFFTAAINGCSVFIVGQPDNPTVYHCGGDTGVNGIAGSAKFWRDMMTRMGGSKARGVDKEDYIKTEGVRDGQGYATTQAAKDYQTWLDSEYSGRLEIKDVMPWGCVMGIRDNAGLWKFYLQENATVAYYTLKKKGIFSNSKVHVKEKINDVKVDKVRAVSRPICFREIYPDQSQGVRIGQPVPTITHG